MWFLYQIHRRESANQIVPSSHNKVKSVSSSQYSAKGPSASRGSASQDSRGKSAKRLVETNRNTGGRGQQGSREGIGIKCGSKQSGSEDSWMWDGWSLASVYLL